jgi:hypothetical protein
LLSGKNHGTEVAHITTTEILVSWMFTVPINTYRHTVVTSVLIWHVVAKSVLTDTTFLHLKANSHIACRAHAVLLPCRSLIHTRYATPLPCSDSAVSFVKVRMVAGNIRTASPAV